MIIFLLEVVLALETLGSLTFSKTGFRLEIPLKKPISFFYSFRILGQFGALTYCCRYELKELRD